MFFEPQPEDQKLTVFDAIRNRHAIRSYTSKTVHDDKILSLIDFAVQAPSARNQQAWSFVVVQSRELLKEISDKAKANSIHSIDLENKPNREHGHPFLKDPSFDIFYGSTTLIIICTKKQRDAALQSNTDCYLAGENLMLAATGMGLATCPIGLAIDVLCEPAMGKKLGIESDFMPVLPIIVGYAAGITTPKSINLPIIQWVRN